jgi:hypothetical protein
VIWLIQSALINGQSQPWMYEVLALTMQIQRRPQAEIDRVVLSLADFGTADFGTVMFSAAYLKRLGRNRAALDLYREASRRIPEQPEPYVLGLRAARELRDAEALAWAAEGTLKYAWTREWKGLHREAEGAFAESLQMMQQAGDAKQVAEWKVRSEEARRRDLVVRLLWTGEGDLDLLIEEPGGNVCSFENRDGAGGGVLVHDGYGPRAENCFEEYIATLAMRGEYRIRVRHAWGQVVGQRATLTIIRNLGTPQQTVDTRTITLGSEEPVIRVAVEDGRREHPRTVTTMSLVEPIAAAEAPARPVGPVKGEAGRVAKDFVESRQEMDSRSVRRVGAIGFQPVIQTIPDGATFSASAVVSPDRRYVRMGVNPSFSNITDVFTFSFVTGVNLSGFQPGVTGAGN